MKLLAISLSGLLLLASVGCVSQPTYYWGKYEHRLYKSYSNPETAPEFHAELLRILEQSKRRGMTPPPGIAAEYGFAEYKKGNVAKAIEYFQLEMETWPESVEMLTVVVENIMAMDGPEQDGETTTEAEATPETAEGGSGS
jgi:hypothetical protein